MKMPIDTIYESTGNARKIAPTIGADRALAASINAIGMLQPILIVPNLDGCTYEVRAGHRRLAAAKSLGWAEVPVMILEPSENGHDEVPETAMSAAENMVRAPMHPVDQWRAIVDLRDACAYSLETAAAALGIDLRLAQRLEHLGRLAPEMLELISTGDLPDQRHLRLIALAPHERQRAALAKCKGAARYQAGDDYFWHSIAEACVLRRIGMSRAIFDTKLMAWDEDLFAAADDDDRFTTTEIDDFLVHQAAALHALAVRSKGRIEIIEDEKLPKGWRPIYGEVPKRWKKEDPRRQFAHIYRDGWQVGEVNYHLAAPIEPVQSISFAAPAPVKPPITKAVLNKLADLKAEAVRSRLEQFRDNGAEDVLRALLLLFTCQNVSAGTVAGSPYGVIASALINPDGTVNDEADLCGLASWIIGTALQFDAPDRFRASGPGAEWIATTIGAAMPRTDTADVLRGINRDELIEIAVANGIKPKGNPGALRKAMAGALPDWRAVDFGAEGPTPEDPDDDPDEPDAVEASEADEREEAA